MKAGMILTAGDPAGYVCGDFLMRSIRATMPGVPVVQLTDEDSPPLVGVDVVHRRPWKPLALFIAEHWSKLDGDWLLVDTDVVVQKDVRPVFDQLQFDLAAATREGTPEAGTELAQQMPYNCGVVYSKSRQALQQVLEFVREMSPSNQQWWGVQLAVAKLRPLLLFNTFNFPPGDDKPVDAHVLHYKGPWRKKLLLERIYREVVGGA
jgi:hypothetical protein